MQNIIVLDPTRRMGLLSSAAGSFFKMLTSSWGNPKFHLQIHGLIWEAQEGLPFQSENLNLGLDRKAADVLDSETFPASVGWLHGCFPCL